MAHFLQPLYEALRVREVNDWVDWTPEQTQGFNEARSIKLYGYKICESGSGHIQLNLATSRVFFFDDEEF